MTLGMCYVTGFSSSPQRFGPYTNAAQIEVTPPIALLKRESHAETVTELAEKLDPNANFRLVTGNSADTDGIGSCQLQTDCCSGRRKCDGPSEFAMGGPPAFPFLIRCYAI
ncbi:hypothetical protein LZ31DRAFT_598049 [Colletotrichum somersetense]|nr:hypothetical protein LZ31DRAFT_598049 [Colletotrichum somersetense]